MGRKMLDVMVRKLDLLEKVDVIEHEKLKLLGDGAERGVERGVERKDRLVFTSPSDWSPEQTEQYLDWRIHRSEEHTSELQSPCNLVCRLLLEKKKKKNKQTQRAIERIKRIKSV